jgi:hypothetical protein
VIAVCSPSAARQQNGPRPVQSTRGASCRKFAQEFYTWYRRATEHNGYEAVLTSKSSLLDRPLLRALRADLAAQKRTPGEIVGLDFDPFLNSQDIADAYTAQGVSQRGDRYFVNVFARTGRQNSTRPAVIPELELQHGKWVFVNFHYPGETPRSSGDDLLSILRKLRAERGHGR